MDLFFYSKEKKGVGRYIFDLYQELMSEYQVEFFQAIESLSLRLRQPLFDHTIALLLAGKREDLFEILFIKDLLDRVRIILILPDDNSDTIRKGHMLAPRFLTFADSNFSLVKSVLMQMIQNRKNLNETIWLP